MLYQKNSAYALYLRVSADINGIAFKIKTKNYKNIVTNHCIYVNIIDVVSFREGKESVSKCHLQKY